jgi:hypothetical protein
MRWGSVDVGHIPLLRNAIDRAVEKAAAETKAKLIVRYLSIKFGPVPDDLTIYLATLGVDALDRIFDRALVATCTEAVMP